MWNAERNAGDQYIGSDESWEKNSKYSYCSYTSTSDKEKEACNGEMTLDPMDILIGKWKETVKNYIQ